MRAQLEIIMAGVSDKALTLHEFLALPESDPVFEFVDGKLLPKMSPKFFHASLQEALLTLLKPWCRDRGRVRPEWAVVLQRQGQDWVPTPDLLYISYERLPRQWLRNEACPVAPELAIEIFSLGQTFGQMAQKATDYLSAGVSRVWVVDDGARTISVFYPDRSLMTLSGTEELLDPLLEGFRLTPAQLFEEAGLAESS